MLPAASGSLALVLRSMRRFQPAGDCANKGLTKRNASTAVMRRRFISLLQAPILLITPPTRRRAVRRGSSLAVLRVQAIEVGGKQRIAARTVTRAFHVECARLGGRDQRSRKRDGRIGGPKHQRLLKQGAAVAVGGEAIGGVGQVRDGRHVPELTHLAIG